MEVMEIMMAVEEGAEEEMVNMEVAVLTEVLIVVAEVDQEAEGAWGKHFRCLYIYIYIPPSPYTHTHTHILCFVVVNHLKQGPLKLYPHSTHMTVVFLFGHSYD